jgi:hypothetical protein
MANSNPTPAGYSVQFGYGVQPESKATEYIDSKGVRLNHTFTEINALFDASGDSLIGTNRGTNVSGTGGSIASGTTLAQSINSITQSIIGNRGQTADLEYWFQNNTKGILGMEKNEDAIWVAGGGATVSADSAHVKIGYQTQKIASPDNLARTLYATMAMTHPADLTKFNSLFASADDSAFIRFAIYISDGSKIDPTSTVGITLILSDDPTCATNRKRISLTGAFPAGAYWVFIDAQKGAFVDDTGVANWANIQGARIAWGCTANASGTYLSWDDVWMCRRDPLDVNLPNPFQRKINGVFTRDFAIRDSNSKWYVGDQSIAGFLEMEDINAGTTGTGSTPCALQGQIQYTDFVAEMMVFIQDVGFSNELCWEISDTERIKLYLDSQQLVLLTHFDTVEATYTTPFNTNGGDLVVLTLEKSGSTVIGKVKQSVDFDISTVRAEINTTKAGVISLANRAINSPLVTMAVSTTKYAEIAGKAYIIGNTPWFSVVSRDNAAHDYYVDPVNGNDQYHNGLSAGAAFRTIQRLLIEPFAYTYIRNNIINIYLATGNYGETITMPPIIGSGTMNWIGAGIASAGTAAVSIDRISAHGCMLYTTFQNINVIATATAIYVDKCQAMYFYQVVSTSNGSGSDYGIQATYSNVHAQSCIFSHKSAAFKGHFPGTHILVQDCTGVSNTYSLYCEFGAIGHINGAVPAATLSSYNTLDSLIIPFASGAIAYAVSAGTAAAAFHAAYADSATTADAAAYAASAAYAVSASTAQRALSAVTAGKAANITSGTSISIATSVCTGDFTVSGTLNATVSYTASAGYAASAAYAVSATTAQAALSAVTAARATTADKAAALQSGVVINIGTSICSGDFTVSGTLNATVAYTASAAYAVSASTAAQATTAVNAVSALYAISASTAARATTADNVAYAASAGYAVSASSAVWAASATTAVNAVSSVYAISASTAAQATTAVNAVSSLFAVSAGTAAHATSANTAAYAVSAGYATAAGTAVYAATAGTAAYAVSAGYATAAGTAVYAVTAGTAAYAVSAGYATAAGTATYAISAGYSTSALYAISASTAANATTAATAQHCATAASVSGLTVAMSAIVNLVSGLVTAVNASSLNLIIATAGAGVNASTLTNLVSGNTVAASAVNNALSGLVASVNGTNLNSLLSGLGNTVSAAKLNDSISGLISTAGLLNDVMYRAGASTSVKFANFLIQGSAADNTTLTSVTAFGLSTVLGTWANANGVAAAICPNVSFTATSVTLRLFFGLGTAVTAGNAVYLTIYAFGYV